MAAVASRLEALAAVVPDAPRKGEDLDSVSTAASEEEECGEAAGQGDWWSQADIATIRSFEGISEVSRVLDARVLRHPTAKDPKPWQGTQSEDLYKVMGMRDPTKTYVVCWINMGDKSLVFLSEATDAEALRGGLGDGALAKRVKFIFNPVEVGVPCPAKGPRDADTAGSFFGEGASLSWATTSEGAQFAVLQIDVFSKMLLRMMLNTVAFRQGNTAEFIMVDWPGRAVLASLRCFCTPQMVEMLQ